MINHENTTSYIDIEQLKNSLKFYLSTPLSIQEKIMISYSKSRHAQKLEELSFFFGILGRKTLEKILKNHNISILTSSGPFTRQETVLRKVCS